MAELPDPGGKPTVAILKACELVGVSRRTIYNWMEAGKVDWCRTAGGGVRILVETLWKRREDGGLGARGATVDSPAARGAVAPRLFDND